LHFILRNNFLFSSGKKRYDDDDERVADDLVPLHFYSLSFLVFLLMTVAKAFTVTLEGFSSGYASLKAKRENPSTSCSKARTRLEHDLRGVDTHETKVWIEYPCTVFLTTLSIPERIHSCI